MDKDVSGIDPETRMNRIATDAPCKKWAEAAFQTTATSTGFLPCPAFRFQGGSWYDPPHANHNGWQPYRGQRP
jgi:hypothetical protein